MSSIIKTNFGEVYFWAAGGAGSIEHAERVLSTFKLIK